MSTIQTSANKLFTLVEQEKAAVGGDGKKVFIGGFSQGGQMTTYMQLAKLTYALGGNIVLAGYPLPPLVNWPALTTSAARA